MLYAKVVLGIPVAGPFDYVVPSELGKKIKVGSRVKVNFGHKDTVAYVVGLAKASGIAKLKPILEVLDDFPALDRQMLLLTKQVSEYYFCSWGEAIETALPQALRKSKGVSGEQEMPEVGTIAPPEITLLHSLDEEGKWNIYIKDIKEALACGGSVIILVPDLSSALRVKETIAKNTDITPDLIYRQQPKELEWWLKARRGESKIIVGTRSAVFVPLPGLKLLIIDEEQNSAYKQDQVPHYHAREVAFMRSDRQGVKLVLGSSSPSLESLRLAKENKIKYIFIPRKKALAEIKIINTFSEYNMLTQRKLLLTKYLQDAVVSALSLKEKVLLFINRKGFATQGRCQGCGVILKCPRCNINLVYHFKDNILNCHYCNFKIPAPKICPSCNSGYIKYSGSGSEKIESELSRIFPQERLALWDKQAHPELKDADIFVATSSVAKETNLDFGLVGVLSIDDSLNRVDLRSGEKAFALLTSFLGLTTKKFIIQTRIPEHYCFQALLKNASDIFYQEELKQRKQLGFPPFRHLALVKLRGKYPERVREVSHILFEKLKAAKKVSGVKTLSVNPAWPAQLRGNHYWQVLISAGNIKSLGRFLKINLKDLSHSGIIMTVDVDPY